MRRRGALIRHDALLCCNALRVALKGWVDRAILLIGIPILLLMARAALARSDDASLALAGGAIGLISGFVFARLAHGRLEYHRTEGILAARALERGPALRFATALFATGSVAAIGIAALVALPMVAWTALALPIGGAMGALVGCLKHRLRLPGAAGSLPRFGRSRLDRPTTGLLLAAPVIAISAIANVYASPSDAIGIAAAASAAGALLLAPVDAAKVRFMAQCGHPALHAVWREVRPLAIFILAVAVAAVPMVKPSGVAIVIALPLALLVVQPLRIMLFRAYGRRTADLLFAAMVAGLALAWFAAPFAAPLAHAGMLWWTARHTRPARWRIA